MYNRRSMKTQMANQNTYAIEIVEKSQGLVTYYLKGCYHCRKQFIAERASALACSNRCSVSISRKLSNEWNFLGTFRIKEVEREIDFNEYDMREGNEGKV